jgi:3-methyl-2-oxobutanoate hydroxymethyltransferase
VRNAGRFLTEGLADVVKIEADDSFAPLVGRMARAGVPVCAHVGARPQRVAVTGGYASAGRTPDDAERIVADAQSLEAAGAVMLLVEATPPSVTERIMASTRIPLIGIGAGPDCHGQVLVLQDLLGMTDKQPPFAGPVAQMGEAIQKAGEEFVRLVTERRVTDHRYEMKIAEGLRPSRPGVAR